MALARTSYKRKRSDARNIKRKEEKKMKLDKLLEDILWEIEAAGKDCPESLRQFEEKIKKAIYI